MNSYNPKQPSPTFDRTDYQALLSSNLLAELARNPQLHFDSEEDASAFFARELDYIKSKTYDVLYPELGALNLFPVTHEVPEGAESSTYYGYDEMGMADIINNYATDLPRVDAKGIPTTIPVKSIGASYGYNVQEMRASRYTGKGLDARRAEIARRAIERKINAISWMGDKKSGLPGILSTDNNIPLYVLPAGTGGATSWLDKEPDEVLADASGMLSQISNTTMDVEHPDTLLIPSHVYTGLGLKRIPGTDSTILKFLKDNLPEITIKGCAELNANATMTNPYGKGVALLYRNDPDKISIEIPMPFLQHPVQYENLEVKVPCEARMVGAVIYYPLSLMVAVGV